MKLEPVIRVGWTTRRFGDARKTGKSNRPSKSFTLKLAKYLGVKAGRLIWMDQVHGNRVGVVGNARGGGVLPATDGCVTRLRDIALCIRTADCLPIALHDRRGRAVAALHAGWRGLLAGIVSKGVRQICRAAKTKPGNLFAMIGPSIQLPCYETGDDVRDRFVVEFGTRTRKHFRVIDGKIHMSLAGIAVDQLRAAGLDAANIEVSGLCTACEGRLFFSYRGRQEDGRMATYILIRE